MNGYACIAGSIRLPEKQSAPYARRFAAKSELTPASCREYQTYSSGGSTGIYMPPGY